MRLANKGKYTKELRALTEQTSREISLCQHCLLLLDCAVHFSALLSSSLLHRFSLLPSRCSSIHPCFMFPFLVPDFCLLAVLSSFCFSLSFFHLSLSRFSLYLCFRSSFLSFVSLSNFFSLSPVLQCRTQMNRQEKQSKEAKKEEEFKREPNEE